IPYLLREFNVPVVGTPLTNALIKAKARDHKMMGEAQFVTVQPGDRVQYGSIEAEFVHINHSVAGACALALRTPVGTIFHTGDFKFDQPRTKGSPRTLRRSRASAKKACCACFPTAPMPSAPGTRSPNV